MARLSSLPEKAGQRGAAVIVALLVVALVAGIAAAAVGDLGIALENAGGRHDQEQARQLARAAVDWARNVLAEDARTTAVDHLSEPWAMKVMPTPVEEGEVGGEIIDYSGRFNLNNLLRGEALSTLNIARFKTLLQLLGVPDGEAAAQIESLLDWLDADDQVRSPESAEATWYAAQTPARRPANAPLVTVDELLLVRGFSAALVARLRPFVAALPAGSTINVNTAPPEVLAAAIPGLGLDAARRLVSERQRAWFKDVGDFSARLPQLDKPPDFSSFATSSRYFLAIARARYGVSMTGMEVLLDRNQKWSDILWLRQL